MTEAQRLLDDGSSKKRSTDVPSQGTTLYYKVISKMTAASGRSADGAQSEAWEKVENLTDITGFNGSASMTEVTRLDSDGKEKRPGLQDWGQVTISLLINFKETSHKALLKAKQTGAPLDFKLALSDKTTIEFTAYVKDFPISAKIDARISGAISLEITGDIIVTPGP